MGDFINKYEALAILCFNCENRHKCNDKFPCRERELIFNAQTIDAVHRSEYERVCRERDAAIADLHKLVNMKGECFACIHDENGKCLVEEYRKTCSADDDINDKWEWRGVQKGEQ